LYRSCTERGQKRISEQKSGFCTFVAVDMQAFFHSRTGFADFWMAELVCLDTRQLPGRDIPQSSPQSSVVGKKVFSFLAPVSAVPLSSCRQKNGRAVLTFASAGFAWRCRTLVALALPVAVDCGFPRVAASPYLVNLNRYINW
jgi:hypothetical protein